jgi:hypothetical protein
MRDRPNQFLAIDNLPNPLLVRGLESEGLCLVDLWIEVASDWDKSAVTPMGDSQNPVE